MASIQAKTIPAPGQLPNVNSDAQRVFQALQAGGVAIVPSEFGYGLASSSSEAVGKAFATKKRQAGHAQALIGPYELHRELHILDEWKFEMTHVLTQDLGIPLGIVAPYRNNHPMVQNFTPDTIANITKNDTICIFVGGGPLTQEIARLHFTAGQAMVGSSANITGSGQKHCVEDIEHEIKEAADLIVDYGLQRCHDFGRPSTLVDFANMKVLRMGSYYETFRERMQRFWGISLPEGVV
ncbi:hypothetical protein N7510_006039 [Penicillium lagena]|uniref:uncharacterized protein n=1 Tax=Penicillium lagena TaxID=94218 RepID=UPI002541CCF0|nr:uncharacterized protein N7510_006039 [Penicillium lagena]KAJ5612845.1 hypothetical protein N7510_006039 [Penicillium lagena]